MKTIIKYELVINKALRSALNYDTPDEQINEFIRFFGKHIGSDRIYIYLRIVMRSMLPKIHMSGVRME